MKRVKWLFLIVGDPRRLLRNIANLPHLWHVTQNANKDERKYQFKIYDSENINVNLTRGLTCPPLLDLTTLLVLFDTDVLEHIFSVFPKIAISVETALDIQQLAHPYLGGYRAVVGIRDFLKANVDRILQPSDRGWQAESGQDPIDIPLEEIKCLAATKLYSVYLDDVISRTYVLDQNHEVQAVTTLDVLTELERREILSTSEVAHVLATLISWNVGVVVSERYFLAAIPPEVQSTTDLDSLVEILTEDQTFKNLVDGVWDIRQDYKGVLNHFAAVLADIAKGQSVEAEFVAAIWAIWELKVELRPIDISREKHRALVMIYTAKHTENHEVATKKLWDAYILLVYRQYGSRMDEQKDKEARKQIGIAAAQVVAKNDGKVSGDDLLKTLLCPFESGVAEYDWVSRAYVQERTRLETIPDDSE